MSRLPQRDYTYFTTVRGMCRRCRQVVPARVFFRDGAVWQEPLCPTCPGDSPPARIAGDAAWYLANVLQGGEDRSPLPFSHPPRLGCPHDCGPCSWHASPCQLPVLSVTNACQLRCPICFTYNRADRVWHMDVQEMRRTVDWIVQAAGQVDLINITGGEPTLHPHILDLLACCRRPEIGRITMNSNGLLLAEDFDLCRRLAEMNVYVILSLNTLDSQVSLRMHGADLTGAKLQAIDNLTRAGAKMTLLTVLAGGVNEATQISQIQADSTDLKLNLCNHHEIREISVYEESLAAIWPLMRDNDSILGLTVQTIAYTGQGGGGFERSVHIPVDQAARIVCAASGGQIEFGDFVTRPAAHPLCYLVCYALKAGGDLLPFARLAGPDRPLGADLIRDSYLIRPDQGGDFFTDAINRLYAEGRTEHLAVLRGLIERLYPPGRALGTFERQRAAESAVRTVYVHAHMDEDTFDCSRAMRCPDLVPAQPGRLVPACTYNLFYRMQDERFYVPPSESDACAPAGRASAVSSAETADGAGADPSGPCPRSQPC